MIITNEFSGRNHEVHFIPLVITIISNRVPKYLSYRREIKLLRLNAI